MRLLGSHLSRRGLPFGLLHLGLAEFLPYERLEWLDIAVVRVELARLFQRLQAAPEASDLRVAHAQTLVVFGEVWGAANRVPEDVAEVFYDRYPDFAPKEDT